jgi:DNA-binding IclR family transcriptional regulator
VASSALHRLHERTGETVSLLVRVGDDALYLDKIVSPRPLRFTTRVGSRVPLPLTAGGKALLAMAGDGPDVVHRVAARAGMAGRVDAEKVLKQLAEARRRGYAVSNSRPGLVSVAAPVTDRNDEPVAALSVSAPTDRLPRGGRAEVVEAVLSTATGLAESLGRM